MTVIESYLSSLEFISHIGGVLLAIVSLYAWNFWTREAFYSGFPVYGFSKKNISLSSAKEKYLTDGRRILLEGAKKVIMTGRVYRFKTLIKFAS